MMKHYKFKDIEIGTVEEFSVDITDENMELFAKFTGDLNPMHLDADYAKLCSVGV